MTLIVDDSDLHPALEADRRAPSVAPRRSWASPLPYVPQGDATPDEGKVSRPWRRASAAYVRATIAADGLNAFLVTTVLMLPSRWLAPVFGMAAAVIFVAIVAALRGYARQNLGSTSEEFQSALRGAMLLALVTVFVDFAFNLELPRRVVFVGLPVLALVTWMDRFRRRKRLHSRRARGEAMQGTLVVGEPLAAARVVSMLEAAPHQGFAPVGLCLPDPEAPSIGDVRVLGGVADIVQVVVDHQIDVVVIASGTMNGDALRRLTWALGRVDTELVMAPDLVDVAGPRLTLREANGLSLLEVEVGVPRGRRIAKALLDRVVGGVGLLAASPLIALAALLVTLTSRGGAFFRQTRVGLDGETFTMWKLRTMTADAEARKAELKERSDADGVLFKMRDDPRITPVGKVLRRYSIDELPQLWNVVRGDMSLVGPRPPLLDEVAMYPDHVGRRLHVRPGLTGLWQVSGRSDLDWESAVTLDLRYVDNWSLTMDLMILWKTGRAVLRPDGAY